MKQLLEVLDLLVVRILVKILGILGEMRLTHE